MRGGPLCEHGEADCTGRGHELDDQDDDDQIPDGQAEYCDSVDSSLGGDAVYAIDEEEVGEHVDEQRAEASDLAEGRLQLAEGEFRRVSEPESLHLVLNWRLRHPSEGQASES